MAKKKISKRIPLPRKPPKVEVPKKAYSRKRYKKKLRELLKQFDNTG